MTTKIAIFDDNKNIRNSMVMLINTDPAFEVIGVFYDARNCVQKILETKPDVVLMDIQMPGINGIEAVRLIKKELPHIEILIQTVFEDDENIFNSILAGASGYILKSHLNKRLLDDLRELQYGGSPMSPSIARKVLNMMQNGTTKASASVEYNLTPREKDVLTCIVKGLSYKMIGYELNISYETVRSHVKKIYEKLHVGSLTEAVAKAINQNIV